MTVPKDMQPEPTSSGSNAELSPVSRKLVTLASMILSIGMFLLLFPVTLITIRPDFPLTNSLVVTLAGFVVTLLAAGTLLGRGQSQLSLLRPNTQEALEAKIRLLKNDLDSIRETVERRPAGSIDDSQLQAISDYLRPLISQSILKRATEFYRVSKNISDVHIELLSLWRNARTRISDEIGALSGRSKLTMLIGIGMALMGVILLGFSSLLVTKDTDVLTIALSAVSRFPLVLIIEIVAFFFLRLYKSNLEKIEYFQNELTNIELKAAALMTVLASGRSAF